MEHQLMIFSILFSLLAFTSASQCACSELLQQIDCESKEECKWLTINGNSLCQTISLQCSDFHSQDKCDGNQGCAWTNDQACANFTKCSDYIIPSIAEKDQCYLKDQSCIPGAESGSQVTCTTGTIICSNITDQKVCMAPSIVDSEGICWWQTSCTSQDVSKCSIITDSTLCIDMDCIYNNTICQAPKCTSYKTQSSCTYARDDREGFVYLCAWVNGSCIESSDTNTLTSANCYSNTDGLYRWNGQACTACTGEETTCTPEEILNSDFKESLVIGNNESFVYFHQFLVLEQRMKDCIPSDKIVNATLYIVNENQKQQVDIPITFLETPEKARFIIYIEKFWKKFQFAIEAVTLRTNFTLRSKTFDCVVLNKEIPSCSSCEEQCELTGIIEEGCGNCIYSSTVILSFFIFQVLISL